MTNKPADRIESPGPSPDESGRDGPGAPFPIVGVGASAGGLEAFTQLLKHLPPDTGMGFVLVQHLDPEHESALTQILSRATSLPVTEIADNQRVEPNRVYVIPRDTSLSIARGVLKLEPRQKIRVPHRPIDAFFESLAADQRDLAIGVVLSGTATDGTLGLEAIKAEGGITFAQDDSAKHDSMPRSAVAAGCVDLVLAPAGIAEELARIARHPYAAGQAHELQALAEAEDAFAQDDRGSDARGEDDRAEATAHQDDDTALPSGGSPTPGKSARGKGARQGARPSSAAGATAEGYKKILLLLRNHSGVDFSLYKSTTIQRRISRRMILTKHDTLAEYAGFLRNNSNPKEIDALYSDVLISVTSFFRNPEMFDVLQRTVLPELLKQRTGDPLRCWVLGCSTGQEAYSIAMAFVEAAEKAPRMRKLQIFATDLNEALLDKARHGLYAKSLADEIAPERLRRFFAEEEGGYRIIKGLREMVVFARQNLIADPPFTRMDIVSCRNLLIYLEPSLQKKALPTFHYALRPGGFLLLGASESIGGFTDLFEPVDRKHKIFSRKAAPAAAFHLPATKAHVERTLTPPGAPPLPRPRGGEGAVDALRGELNAQREADRITVNQFAPSGVLVSADLQVLQFRGTTGAYLEPPAGKATFDVLKMAREGLMLPLRAAINEARKENRSARRENVRVKRNGKVRTVTLEVIPLKNLPERCFLVLFEEAEKSGRARRAEVPAAPPISKAGAAARVAELESDLSETREYLQSLQEQHEAANEELQAANEEVQSANEELQSINEELETSKEELESANEELSTVNEEMSHRNVELNWLNNDLVNLQTSTRLAIVLVGRDLTLRRFSPQAQKQFDLLATDVGRPIAHLRHGLVSVSAPSGVSLPESAAQSAEGVPADLEGMLAEVIASVREQDCEVRDRAGRWLSMHVRPYMTFDNKVDGAVLVLADIDALKQTERAAAYARDYAEGIIATVREPLVVLDSEMRIERANLAFYRAFRVSARETLGKFFFDLDDRRWDVPHVRELLEKVLARGITIEDFQVEHEAAQPGRQVMLLNARRIHEPLGKSARILLAIEDITARTRAEEALRGSEERFRAIADSIPQLAWMADAEGRVDWFNRGWLEYTGTTLEANQGVGWKAVHHPDYVDRVAEKFERHLREGKDWEDTFPLRGKDGRYRWFLSRMKAIRGASGRIERFFGTNTDITEQRQMADALEQNAVFLTEGDRRKDEFLAMLAHELRNPLAPIRNGLNILRRAASPASGSANEAIRSASEIVERQVVQMVRLVDDLLDVSRISRGTIELRTQRVELASVVDHAVEAIGPACEIMEHELSVSVASEPVVLNADPIRLAQALGNLLNNACKFTAKGGRISLNAGREGGEAVFRVRDSGIGIAAGNLPRIFGMFAQVDTSLERSAGGLGIGLTLAKTLVVMHGGTMEARSDGLGEGSEFVMRLPIPDEPVKAPPPAPAVSASPPMTARRILVVDDNPDSATSLAMLLQLTGNETHIAHDGLEAVDAAAAFRPDVVLLDIGLPKLNGYEAARRIREQPSGNKMVLVALTGWGQEEDRRKSSEAGFDGHLVKPVDYPALMELLAALLPARNTG